MTLLLLDTNVIIDHLRGHAGAVRFMSGLNESPLTSVIVVAELYAGVREGAERVQLERFLSGMSVLPLSNSHAIAGGLLRRQFGKSHNVGLEDSLIAATAAASNATPVSLNAKHFPMLSEVIVPYSKP
jgi:predicted nucleic acid-binding protein